MRNSLDTMVVDSLILDWLKGEAEVIKKSKGFVSLCRKHAFEEAASQLLLATNGVRCFRNTQERSLVLSSQESLFERTISEIKTIDKRFDQDDLIDWENRYQGRIGGLIYQCFSL